MEDLIIEAARCLSDNGKDATQCIEQIQSVKLAAIPEKVLEAITPKGAHTLQDLASLAEIVTGLNLGYIVLERFRYKRRIVSSCRRELDRFKGQEIPDNLKKKFDYRFLHKFADENKPAFNTGDNDLQHHEWVESYRFWYGFDWDRRITKVCVGIGLLYIFFASFYASTNLPFSVIESAFWQHGIFGFLILVLLLIGAAPVYFMSRGDTITNRADAFARQHGEALLSDMNAYLDDEQNKIRELSPPKPAGE